MGLNCLKFALHIFVRRQRQLFKRGNYLWKYGKAELLLLRIAPIISLMNFISKKVENRKN